MIDVWDLQIQGTHPRDECRQGPAVAIIRAILKEAHHVDELLLMSSRRGKRAAIGPQPRPPGKTGSAQAPGANTRGPPDGEPDLRWKGWGAEIPPPRSTIPHEAGLRGAE